MATAPSSSTNRQTVQVSKREWEKGLAAVKVSKDDLNRIVLDYLIIEGYRDAAAEFARESGLDPRVDYESIQERMLIREAIESGRVEEAVRRVNELDSEILDTNPPLLFHLQLQIFIELIRQDRITEALAFASAELAPRGAQNPEFLFDLERTMALLAFPELAAMGRAKDEVYTGTEALWGPASLPPTASQTAAAGDEKREPPWTSLGNLMRKEHRIKVAKELNAAILESQGQGQETKLGGLIRLMSWGEEQLRGRGIIVPGVDVSTVMQTGVTRSLGGGVPPAALVAESDRMITT